MRPHAAVLVLAMLVAAPGPLTCTGDSKLALANFALCARFSTRYEEKHVLPWVRWHAHLGVDRFLMYFDSLSSDLSDGHQRDAYDRLLAHPLVTVFNTSELQIERQGRALKHCVQQVDATANWGMDMDVDEILVGGDVLGPGCKGRTSLKGFILQHVSRLPTHVLGVVVPRISFSSNGHRDPPLATQMQAYTARPAVERGKRFGSGKVIFRGGAGAHRSILKHTISTYGGHGVVYPDMARGVPGNCSMRGRQAWCSVSINGYNLSKVFHSLRMHHYATRSLSECARKLVDVAAPWHAKQGMSTWRRRYFAVADTEADPGLGARHADAGAASMLAACASQSAITDVHDYTAACHTRGYLLKRTRAGNSRNNPLPNEAQAYQDAGRTVRGTATATATATDDDADEDRARMSSRGGSTASSVVEADAVLGGVRASAAHGSDDAKKPVASGAARPVPGLNIDSRVLCNTFEEFERGPFILTLFAAHQQQGWYLRQRCIATHLRNGLC